MLEIARDFKGYKVSFKNIEAHRTAYEKLINKRFSINNTDNTLDYYSIANIVYDMLIASSELNNSNSAVYYKENYINAKNLIINYYTEYFRIKQMIADYKEVQFNEIREIIKKIKDDGTPVYIAKHIYSMIKNDKRLADKNEFALDISLNIYDSIKEEIKSNINQIELLENE